MQLVSMRIVGNRRLFVAGVTPRRKIALRVVVSLAMSFMFITASFAALDSRQIKLLTNNCLQCHASPESTAPLMGVAADWQKVIAQGEEATLKNVVLGIGGMPPLGYCSACSEQDLLELTRFVAGFPDKQVPAQ